MASRVAERDLPSIAGKNLGQLGRGIPGVGIGVIDVISEAILDTGGKQVIAALVLIGIHRRAATVRIDLITFQTRLVVLRHPVVPDARAVSHSGNEALSRSILDTRQASYKRRSAISDAGVWPPLLQVS